MKFKVKRSFFRLNMAVLLVAPFFAACTPTIKKFSTVRCETKSSGFAGGSGTLSDPYLICNGKQLNEVRNHLTEHFKQTADVDLSAAANGKSSNWFLPIGTLDRSNSSLAGINTQTAGYFSGSYNGSGYKIKKFSYHPATDLTRTYVGLFAVLASTGSISNLIIESCEVSGDYIVGCLVAANLGTISNVTVKNSAVTEINH